MARSMPGAAYGDSPIRRPDIGNQDCQVFSVWDGWINYELGDLAVDINETTKQGYIYQLTALPPGEVVCVGKRPIRYPAYWQVWNQQPAIANCSGGESNTQLATKINSMLAAMRATWVIVS